MNTNASRVDELLRRCSAVSASTRRISSDLKEALEVARPSVEKVAKRVELMTQLQEQIQRAEAELSNDPDAAAFARSRQTDWANRFVTWDRLLRNLRLHEERQQKLSSWVVCGGSSQESLLGGASRVLKRTDAEWRQELAAEEYQVLREGGTEPARENYDWDAHFGIDFDGAAAAAPPPIGYFACRGCNLPLYREDSRFGFRRTGKNASRDGEREASLFPHGWPAFNRCLDSGSSLYGRHVALKLDTQRKRCELVCARCRGHLGHLFFNEYRPGGQRHCVNACCLRYCPAEENGSWRLGPEFAAAEKLYLENKEFFEEFAEA